MEFFPLQPYTFIFIYIFTSFCEILCVGFCWHLWWNYGKERLSFFLFVWLVVVIRFQQQQQHFKRNIVLFFLLPYFVWLEKYYFMFYSDMLILMNTFYVLRRNHKNNKKKQGIKFWKVGLLSSRLFYHDVSNCIVFFCCWKTYMWMSLLGINIITFKIYKLPAFIIVHRNSYIKI